MKAEQVTENKMKDQISRNLTFKKMKTITAYNYDENDAAVMLNNELTLSEALSMLEKDECEFIQIEEGSAFVELTKNTDGDIITNGHQS